MSKELTGIINYPLYLAADFCGGVVMEVCHEAILVAVVMKRIVHGSDLLPG
jgi:hypothetical protein